MLFHFNLGKEMNTQSLLLIKTIFMLNSQICCAAAGITGFAHGTGLLKKVLFSAHEYRFQILFFLQYVFALYYQFMPPASVGPRQGTCIWIWHNYNHPAAPILSIFIGFWKNEDYMITILARLMTIYIYIYILFIFMTSTWSTSKPFIVTDDLQKFGQPLTDHYFEAPVPQDDASLEALGFQVVANPKEPNGGSEKGEMLKIIFYETSKFVMLFFLFCLDSPHFLISQMKLYSKQPLNPGHVFQLASKNTSIFERI
ncbi:hypothetical protein ACJX0J_029455 [Zea mays]